MLNRIKRPWEISRDLEQSQGRKVITKFYQSKHWKKARQMFKNSFSDHLPGLTNHNNRFCWICALSGKYTLTHTIDHIKPINREDPFDTKNGHYGEPLTFNNLAPLCEHHANKKNAFERHGKILSIKQQSELLKDLNY